ncbi:Nn.00g006970.m01.CDS01 [Neocucurbitaria sp. VM-36]
MARRLPAHLSHKSALALLPPSNISAPIEKVRRVHDKHFARWPPHINLLYPFLASPSETIEQGESSASHLKETIRTRITKVTKKHEPVKVSLLAEPPHIFSHNQRSKTVWLGPSTQSIQQLQADLQAEFAECDADQRAFTPHLSIGQSRSVGGADSLSKEIQETVREHLTAAEEDIPMSLDWYVDKVYVIERKGYMDRFKVIGTIELGKQ